MVDKYKHYSKKSTFQLPAEIEELRQYCCQFDKGDFKLPEKKDLESILQARYDQRIGACDMRSAAFKYKFDQLKNKYPQYECRLMGNECHAFVEVAKDGYWQGYNLGGYDAKLTQSRKNAYKPPKDVASVNAAQPIKESATLKPPAPKEITEDELHRGLAIWLKAKRKLDKENLFNKFLKEGKNRLVKVKEADDCLGIVADFAKQHPRVPYLLIDSPDDLQISAAGLKLKENNNELRIIAACTNLRQFIEENPQGIVFINWSNFTQTEIAALHCILDERRSLEGKPFSQTNPIRKFLLRQCERSLQG